ncbi:MAG: aromatic amino acid ammonia-lyase, partial [Actinomycetota bacterium]|nr:aromatic amino acid ammonia-lyase [Actinomycetota bacterium]
ADQLVAAGVQAIGGHAEAFDPQVLSARPHPGALRSAERIRRGLGTGGRRHSVGAVPHDPYSWRCAPQVHGAVLDAVDMLRAAVDRELASSSDNPVLAEERDTPLLSGGNFHGAPLGLPADSVTTAVAVAAALSRQRTAQLVSGAHAPTALARPGSTGIGLGPLLVTATAEALRLGGMTPASLRWLPVDPMEDHVPNSLAAARQAVEAAEGLFAVLAVEAICVDAAAELNSVPGNPALDATRALMADAVGPTSEARPMAADIARLAARLDIATVPQRGTP